MEYSNNEVFHITRANRNISMLSKFKQEQIYYTCYILKSVAKNYRGFFNVNLTSQSSWFSMPSFLTLFTETLILGLLGLINSLQVFALSDRSLQIVEWVVSSAVPVKANIGIPDCLQLNKAHVT